MKYSNILKTVAALAAGMLLFSCQQQEEPGEARAVAASETYLAFEAQGAAQQTVEIYADGSWLVDVDSDWISVTPYKGTGMGSITISVTDNVSAGVEDLPRDGKITVQGGTALRNAVITVHQDGDTYKGVQTLTLAQVAKLEDGQVAKVASAQVTALTTSGFIATDDSRSLYVKGEGVAIGDKVSFNGAKTTIGDAAAFEMDEVEVEGSAEVTYPEAKDITATIASYDYSLTEYVSISASLVGTNIYLSADVQVPLLDPVESLELGSVDLHKVVVKGYGVGKSVVAVSVEDGGMNEALIPYPLKFKVRTGINYNSDSWSETSKIPPVNGLGYIEYVPFDLEHTDTPANPKYKLDVSDNSPRVTGPWPGDYWLFYGNGAIKAGSEVHIAFESRTSATGHKFWILEFLDGSEWRPACETFTTTEPGEEVIYTHAMNADGKTNVQADYVVKYRKNSEHAQFRFRCVANWQASGAGPLKARNGGSARLTVTDTADPTYQPVIEIIKEGNGVERDPVYANIEVSTDLLTFNGTPDAPKTITVTSDHDFTVSSTADWLSFDVTEGLAGEETAIAVTCAQSELSELRQAVIKIVSEDSEKSINVVQSAAGQMLDPFISISSANNLELDAEAGSKAVRIQSNVEVSFATEASWITITPVETKALVEWTEYMLEYEANESETPREAVVRFYNEENGAQALLVVTQKGFEPVLENNLIQWGFSPDIADTYKSQFVDDNNLKANIAGTGTITWNSLPENIALDVNSKKGRAVSGKEGHPYVTGVWPGDYWLFTMPIVNVAAGNEISFKGYHQASATGQKYWKMEYSIDGTSWYPVKELQTESETGTNAQYTHKIDVAGSPVLIEESVIVPMAIPKATLQIKFTCVANWQQKGGTLEAPNGGTHRWAGDAESGPTIKIGEPQVDPGPDPVVEYAKVGDILWGENWVGGVAGDTPAAYQIRDAASTVVFGGGDVAYTQNSTSTKLYEDGLVYYNDVANLTDEKYRINLLVTKGNGFLNVDGIPCSKVKTAVLTYKSNSKLEGNHQLTTSTAGVTVGELSESSVPKIDLETKNTYTLTSTISINEGVDSFDLKLTNMNAKSNIRVDGFELVVTEVY